MTTRKLMPDHLIAIGLVALYAPVFYEFFQTVWTTSDQGHGPIIICVSIWLIWRKRRDFRALPDNSAPILGWLTLLFGLGVYLLGRNQMFDTFEAGSMPLVLIGVALVTKGVAGVRLLLFPILFLGFMAPLPSFLVQAITTPLKVGVSYTVENVLNSLGYPIARQGVMIYIGPYQLLVADACSGLSSILTLESLSLLYLNIAQHRSTLRNILLVILVFPISFTANVIRVGILVLVTYYFGDEAGQSYLHTLAGLTLFVAAFCLLLLVDSIFARVFGTRDGSAPHLNSRDSGPQTRGHPEALGRQP